jgi:hypothetical protein
MRNRILSASVIAVLLAAALPAAGEQIAREIVREAGKVRYEVRFHDAQGQARALAFALPADAYDKARRGLQPLRADQVTERLNETVEQYAKDSATGWQDGMRARLEALQGTLPGNVRLDWSFEGRQLSWRIEGRGVTQAELRRHSQRIGRQLDRASARLQQQQKDLRAYAASVREELLEELNYVRDPDLGSRVRPDYAQLARAQADVLKPLSAAIARTARGGDLRARTALALAFLQTIPYDELSVRGATDGTGFAVPAELLHVNRGDCDSKATALAALMHTFAPEVDTAIVLLPGHAVMAADLPVQAGDRTVRLDGRRFVLMEPAGPGRFPVGQVSQESRRLLDSNGASSIVWTAGGPGA